MILKFFLIIGFALLATFTISANAEKFDFEFIDSKNYPISYKLTNATLVNIIQNPPEEFVFEVNGTNGEISVSLPKTMPRDTVIITDFPATVLLNGVEFYNVIESDCFYDHVYPVEGYTKLQFIFAYAPEGFLLEYEELPIYCNKMIIMKSDTGMQIKDTTLIFDDDNEYTILNGKQFLTKTLDSSINHLAQEEPGFSIEFQEIIFTFVSQEPPPPGYGALGQPKTVRMSFEDVTFFDERIMSLAMERHDKEYSRGYDVVFGEFKDEDVGVLTSVTDESDFTKLLVFTNNISPYAQLDLGIEPDSISCKVWLDLIQRSDGSPACVKPETKQKLIERGWAVS